MPAEETGFLERAGRVIRTTAFRLSVVYLVMFVFFAFFVLGYVAWNTRRLLDAQITETIETEINSGRSIPAGGCPPPDHRH